MGVIQIIANRPGAGKTCLAGAVLTRLRQQGRGVGYYRPFSNFPQDDPDVTFISQQLLAGGDGPVVPAPQALPTTTGTNQLPREVREAASSLIAESDTLLVEGPDLAGGSGAGLAVELAAHLESKVLLVLQYTKGLSVDDVASLVTPLEDRLSALVINSFPPHRRREVTQGLVDALEGRGLPVLGAIPDDRYMLAVTVQQVADHLGGHWVQEPMNTDAYIDRFLIGGNIMDAGHYYFGRFENQAVITRSERPDIQMASLMCQTKCLVLTGGAQPTEYVRVEASQREVPLILVERDTISTAEALGGLLERADARSIQKVRRFGELMEEHLDPAAMDALFQD